VRFQILLWQAITILLPFLLIIYSDTCHVTAANGVVIATEKKLPSILVDETSVCVTSSLSMTPSHSNSIICSSGTTTNKIPNANL
jgi:hypothetical protein